MERVISPEERMKRAEEIYYRRRTQGGVRVSSTSVNIGATNKISLGKKMIVQIIVCILIYGSFWTLRSYQSVFSDNVINQTKAFLSYDINFQNLYNESREYFGSHFNNIIKTNSNENVENGENTDKEQNTENKEENVENKKENTENKEENVENNTEENVNNEENTSETSGNENDGIRRWN